ncbi:unnamed protein product [Paramecium octaurelia]|uniref:Uncharacterized protein n=1 Tax=Paramecium octaurelia TaxID=43137 RepID=A0A8S1VD29_PAROT|nr:unnamed protein product [Paramecium octaurelia]
MLQLYGIIVSSVNIQMTLNIKMMYYGISESMKNCQGLAQIDITQICMKDLKRLVEL